MAYPGGQSGFGCFVAICPGASIVTVFGMASSRMAPTKRRPLPGKCLDQTLVAPLRRLPHDPRSQRRLRNHAPTQTAAALASSSRPDWA
jgi:hypothetical protein